MRRRIIGVALGAGGLVFFLCAAGLEIYYSRREPDTFENDPTQGKIFGWSAVGGAGGAVLGGVAERLRLWFFPTESSGDREALLDHRSRASLFSVGDDGLIVVDSGFISASNALERLQALDLPRLSDKEGTPYAGNLQIVTAFYQALPVDETDPSKLKLKADIETLFDERGLALPAPTSYQQEHGAG